MRKSLLVVGGALVALAFTAQSVVAAPALKKFGTGEVAITSGTSATITVDDGEYAGVYVGSKSQAGKALNQVVFQFTSRGDVAGGAPRFSIPIDTDGDLRTNEGTYAFIDAANCGATVGDNPSNAATLVSTQNPSCGVFFDQMYTNWSTFAAAHTDYRTGKATPFIISDVVPPTQASATYRVTDIALA